VVLASAGYPGAIVKGKPISGLLEADRLPATKIFHAGTVRDGNHIVTSGGRVLGVTAWAGSLKAAQTAAYAAVEKIHFDGMQFRRDIAAKGL
jgi:phosphoribosylamine--glycine ligase